MDLPRTRHVALNPITFVGALLAASGLVGLVFLLGAHLQQVETNPYLGLVIWTGVPAVFAAGLVLIPAGILWEARRRTKAAQRGEGIPPAPKLDFGNVHHLLGLGAFAMLSFIFAALLAAGGFRAAHFMDSPTFCGGLCHRVMEPQYEPYKRSAHAEVECTQCHIGPGASWYAQAKLSGLRQVVAVLNESYPRPIPAPIENLRPARDTCEGCHWREKAYGLFLKVYRSVLPDEQNTVHERALAFRVGTGGSLLEEAGGVHWHTSAKVWYRSADRERQVIAWVQVEKPEGSEEWVNPDVAAQEPLEDMRLMDCIDCHNRAAHRIPPPGELIDDALLDGRLDPELPYVKREALELMGVYGTVPEADVLAARWSEDGWFEQLEEFYAVNYPDIAASKSAAIQAAINELKEISELVLYPYMRVSWLTYPDNRGHPLSEGEVNTGCFRCHAKLVSVDTGRQLEGGLGGGECLTCHGLGEEEGVERLGGDPLDEPACSYCHVSIPLKDLERPLPLD